MPSFREARDLLLAHRTDYAAAVSAFAWPDPVPFNWALDWFDADLARNAESKDRLALWIVDVASGKVRAAVETGKAPILVTLDPARLQITGSRGEFAWGGNGSTAFWVDPVEQTVVLLTTQLMPSSTYPLRRELRVAVNQALTD